MNGDNLPSGLSFDLVNQKFIGSVNVPGIYKILMTGDTLPFSFTVSATFLMIAYNNPPKTIGSIATQNFTVGKTFVY